MKRQTDRNVTGFFQKLLELADPWRVVAVELKDEDRSVEIEVERPSSFKASCPECGRPCAVYDHAATRWWRHLDTMNRTTRLCSRVPRSECPVHRVRTMQVPWAGPGSLFTAEFELQVVDLLLLARSQSQAAQHLELNWHQVHAVQAAAVRRGLARRDTEDIARDGLDEKSFGRGYHYGTVLTDLDHRRVLEVVEHRPMGGQQPGGGVDELSRCSHTRRRTGVLIRWCQKMVRQSYRSPSGRNEVNRRSDCQKRRNRPSRISNSWAILGNKCSLARNPKIKAPRNTLVTRGFKLGAGAGFEPATFRL